MSFLKPLEDLIRKLDREAAAELSGLKADIENRLQNVLPALDKLRHDVKTAVTDWTERAPGLAAEIENDIRQFEQDIRNILKI